MSRLDARLSKLEAVQPAGQSLTCAVVRYNPGTATSWLPGMIERLGWAPSLHTLVTIDASAALGEAPEAVVPPQPMESMTPGQSAVLAQAGAQPGPWWIAITGRGWSDAIPMHDGEAALLAQLRAERQHAGLGWAGGR